MLKSNGLRNRGVSLLCNFLSSHPTICSLDLSENSGISDGGGDAVLSLLQRNRRVEEVCLHRTRISPRLLKRIAAQTASNKRKNKRDSRNGGSSSKKHVEWHKQVTTARLLFPTLLVISPQPQRLRGPNAGTDEGEKKHEKQQPAKCCHTCCTSAAARSCAKVLARDLSVQRAMEVCDVWCGCRKKSGGLGVSGCGCRGLSLSLCLLILFFRCVCV